MINMESLILYLSRAKREANGDEGAGGGAKRLEPGVPCRRSALGKAVYRPGFTFFTDNRFHKVDYFESPHKLLHTVFFVSVMINVPRC